MVMPRSRSKSIASSTCSDISRDSSAPVFSRSRSESVVLPWSMCAMVEKLRMFNDIRVHIANSGDSQRIARIENRRAKGKLQKAEEYALAGPSFLFPTAPQKPRGDGAIWPPAALFGDLFNL